MVGLILQGYIPHKKPHPPRTLQQAYAQGPMVLLGEGGVLLGARDPCGAAPALTRTFYVSLSVSLVSSLSSPFSLSLSLSLSHSVSSSPSLSLCEVQHARTGPNHARVLKGVLWCFGASY